MDLRQTGCEKGRWMELTHEHVQWWALALTMSNLGFYRQSVSIKIKVQVSKSPA
jgi:hypothetical protein